MLAVEMLMPESLLNFRFRGDTTRHEELLVALENNIIDKPENQTEESRHESEIEMATKAKGQDNRYQRIMDITLQAVYRGAGKGHWSARKGQRWNWWQWWQKCKLYWERAGD